MKDIEFIKNVVLSVNELQLGENVETNKIESLQYWLSLISLEKYLITDIPEPILSNFSKIGIKFVGEEFNFSQLFLPTTVD